MLIKCPECELQISDKAISCPHCGLPIRPYKSYNTKKSKQHMRLPNGFGQITKISSKPLRNPYGAMVTVGKTSEGRPICKLLKPVSYFATYNEAYEALVEYNKNPYDIEPGITMSELYDRWSAEYFKKLANDSSIRTIKCAWNYCTEIYSMQVNAIRVRHLKGCIENSDASANIKSRMKSVFNLILDYAVEYELVDHNYARDFKLDSNIIEEKEQNKRDHIAFTEEEIEILWKNTGVVTVQMILIQIYMGWRPQELCKLETKNKRGCFISGGMKTKAGKDRLVPIHSKISELIEQNISLSEQLGSKYLFRSINYDKYNREFAKVISMLGLNPEYRPHDPRKTFVTLAKKYKVDEYAIKRIVGHAVSDITEAIYTERDNEWLKNEIEKIKDF